MDVLRVAAGCVCMHQDMLMPLTLLKKKKSRCLVPRFLAVLGETGCGCTLEKSGLLASC